MESHSRDTGPSAGLIKFYPPRLRLCEGRTAGFRVCGGEGEVEGDGRPVPLPDVCSKGPGGSAWARSLHGQSATDDS